MHFTERETAHILAALRHCAKMDITHLGHFDDVEDGQLSEGEIDNLAERINFDHSDTDTGNDKKSQKFTVVGIHTNVDWEGGLHGASFVRHVVACTPNEPAENAMREAAIDRFEEDDSAENTEIAKEYSECIEIISVLEGHLVDQYDP